MYEGKAWSSRDIHELLRIYFSFRFTTFSYE